MEMIRNHTSPLHRILREIWAWCLYFPINNLKFLKIINSRIKYSQAETSDSQLKKLGSIQFNLIQFVYLCLENTYMQIIIKMQKAYDKPLPCRPPFYKVIYIVSEKLHTSRGRRRYKKTANNKIVALMKREKQTNTSVVYVTLKQRHKLNILRTLKLADCMDIKYNNTIL